MATILNQHCCYYEGDLSADGTLWWSHGQLYHMKEEFSEIPIGMMPTRPAFSPCNRWVAFIRGFDFLLFSTSELKKGVVGPIFMAEVSGYGACTFLNDGTLLVAGSGCIFKGKISDDGQVVFTTVVENVDYTVQDMFPFGNKVCVKFRDVYSKPYIMYNEHGAVVGELAMKPIAVNMGLCMGMVCCWTGSTLGTANDIFIDALFKGGLLQPDVLAEWIKYCAPGATWDRTGLTLPTVEGSLTVLWPPVAKLLEPAEAHEYRLRCAVEGGFFDEFGMTSDVVVNFAKLGQTLFGAHQSLWDVYEDVQQARQALTLTESKSQALAALGRARSMLSDEPALAQVLPTALVSSLCSSDRLAFRHHEPDACKHVNSVFSTITATRRCRYVTNEFAVTEALRGLQNADAHAQRAANRLRAVVFDGGIIPQFKQNFPIASSLWG